MLPFLRAIPGCGDVGVKKARAEIGARTVGGGVTWFPHPGRTHPDLVSRDAPRGGGEGAEAVNQ